MHVQGVIQPLYVYSQHLYCLIGQRNMILASKIDNKRHDVKHLVQMKNIFVPFSN